MRASVQTYSEGQQREGLEICYMIPVLTRLAMVVMFNHTRVQFVLNNTISSHIIYYFVGYVSLRSVSSILTNLMLVSDG